LSLLEDEDKIRSSPFTAALTPDRERTLIAAARA
jgi:hypothetical protein